MNKNLFEENFFNKFLLIDLENDNLFENEEISEILVRYYKKNSINFINFNDIKDKKIIIKKDNFFYGPFIFYDNFTFKKNILFNLDLITNLKKKIFYLEFLNNPKEFINIYIYYDRERFYILKNCEENGLTLKVYNFPEKNLKFILSKKVDLNKDFFKKDLFENNEYYFIEEEIYNLFVKLTNIDICKIYNKHIQIKLDLYSSLIPWEILIKKGVKNRVTFSFNFIHYELNNYKSDIINKNFLEKYNNNISYFYLKPETKNSEKERAISIKNNFDKIIMIDNEDDIINNFRNDFILIISSHGYLKENVNSLILNNKMINLDVFDAIKDSPFFIIFLSCLITLSSKENILRKLIKKGLKEVIFSSFIIEDELALKFFEIFSDNLKILNDPLLNYIYIMENEYSEGFEFFKYFTFYNENKTLDLFNRKNIFLN